MNPVDKLIGLLHSFDRESEAILDVEIQAEVRELPDEYEAQIAQLRRLRLQQTAEGLPKLTGNKFSQSVIGAAFGGEFSLKGMEKDIYLAWQQLFRSLYPAKPVMLDVIWFAERVDLGGGGEQ